MAEADGADLLRGEVGCDDTEGEGRVSLQVVEQLSQRRVPECAAVDLDTLSPWELVLVIAAYKNLGRSHSTPVMLKKLSEVLSEAAASISKPAGSKGFDLFSFCKELPKAIRVCLDDADMAKSHPNQDEFRAHVFEVLCKLVEFTVAFLADYVGNLSQQGEGSDESDESDEEEDGEELDLPALIHILEAISFALDSDMRYYSLLSEKGDREILVLPSRLEFALRVPGYTVRVFDATDNKTHYFCSQKGVNQLGVTCECCNPPSEAVDPVLVSVFWHLANTACVNGYELLLKILRTDTLRKGSKSYKPRTSVQVMALIIRPLEQLLKHDIDHYSWRIVVQHLEESFSAGDMMRICCSTFDDVFQNLKKDLIDKRECRSTDVFERATPFDNIFYTRKAFMNFLIYLHTVRSWSLKAYRPADGVLSFDDPGQLLILFLERIDESKGAQLVCIIFREFLDVCAQALRYEVPFAKNILHWLNEGVVLLRFLTLKCYPEMIRLVEFAGKEGLILKKEVFVTIFNVKTLDERNAHARTQVAVTILKEFNLAPYTTELMASVCNCLIRWQVPNPIISSHTVCCILEKLMACDKDRKLGDSFVRLLWKYASNLPASDFVSCLTKIACNYTSFSDQPKIIIHPGEETEKFLQACSNADVECAVSRHVDLKCEDNLALIEQRAKIYQDMEVNFIVETFLELKHVLDIDVPLSVHQTSNECLKRLGLAQELISGLESSTQNKMVSVMTSAMAPELRTLEAIKKEIALRPELHQRMQSAQERHLKEYDALKQDQYNSLEKFFRDCFKEKEGIVRDALYAKAEVLAAVEMAKLQSKTESSSDGIRKRLLQKVENSLEEAEKKQRECMEKLPNLECNVCFVQFSAKRKRACFDPCGHTGSCIDCGMQEWKRRKICPLCQCNTEEPVAVPSTLFF
ncbi:hypothetical protein M758_1G261400 [Ceratodon purpureus]|nr:hypothetical protein M758_1G261400 [Ceratodon purpureus]KAG0631537.1 hypothetical protein M758_1G261400 [Ceratodon purpureus]KAG0631539.1 hypothetical protein M758_1G261400 [Ceratodon purpureus]